jgi:hypothetical protein
VVARKSAAKPRTKTKGKTKVDTNDPLADLGLEDTAPATAVLANGGKAPKKETQQAAKASEEAGHDEVEVGELEFGFSPFIPTAKRKAEGSKYKFDKLPAPGVFEDGPYKGKPKIANFVVKLQEGVDPEKLRRSVQSATTQANKQGKAEGKYFVSRTQTDASGKFTGMIVYRTDQRPTE